MKKTIVFSLMAASLMFSACSSDSNGIADNEPQKKKGMKLNAVVPENLSSRASIGDTENDTWTFAFTTGDQAKVTNSNMDSYYTFTKSAEEFSSSEAKPTSPPANWYAYFPSTEVSLTNQTGDVADVANKFALAGKTSSATTGEGGLTINMDAKVAVLVIDNQKGAIDINIKNSADTWVTGLAAKDNDAAFDVTTSATQTSILTTTTKGKYYVAVPAGVQLAIKNGDEVIKSTVPKGLEAGKYYDLATTCCCPDGNHPHYIDLGLSVKWACMNVGAQHPHEYGDYFAWAAPEPWYTEGHAYDNPCTSWIAGKTAYDFANAPYSTVNTDLSFRTKWTKYLGSTTSEYKDPSATDEDALKTVLDPEDDAAHVNWRGTWRMPTKEELDELVYNCYWVWTNDYKGTGVKGYIVYEAKSESDKGKKVFNLSTPSIYYTLADNHIFLPAAGCRGDVSLYHAGSDGIYWSSSLIPPDGGAKYAAGGLIFDSHYINRGYPIRNVGQSVRAVCP